MGERTLPAHVGYILDGNRRWARQYGLPVYEGHLAGYNALKDVVIATAEAGVPWISLYTFSVNNWNRAEEEVKGILSLITRLFSSDINELIDRGYKIVVLGSRDRLPQDIKKVIASAEERSVHGKKATVAICFNYGGQEEIVRAAKRIVDAGIPSSEITTETFAASLDAPEVPECDLIVRTSHEQRLSDFMLWRSAYSELLFLDKYWPDMTADDVTDILEEYATRQRRFGG